MFYLKKLEFHCLPYIAKDRFLFFFCKTFFFQKLQSILFISANKRKSFWKSIVLKQTLKTIYFLNIKNFMMFMFTRFNIKFKILRKNYTKKENNILRNILSIKGNLD